jgi:hypothetical protein
MDGRNTAVGTSRSVSFSGLSSPTETPINRTPRYGVDATGSETPDPHAVNHQPQIDLKARKSSGVASASLK